MSYYLAIVNSRDTPLYEAALGNPLKDDGKHLHQFVLHASLDVVDDAMWNSQNMYLRVVDKFNDWFVSAYVTAGNVRFVLLHSVKNEDGIRNFFVDAHELYVKTFLNPFHEIDQTISSPTFDIKLRSLAKRHL
ncbi:trafficking protein-like protein particle complex subunit 2 [Catenaria anguillulae PL171]|uniref:Trafficking protein-like protein particle complex subunit 2 n=1 Tax=Catenaria anguillulae PL171 TaxID=765915 RepID=A0A1Y2HE93_9FUNG|nr:trafficking protein-like protein particle complex subunit 2 [Catenaria anguillulae PL171]